MPRQSEETAARVCLHSSTCLGARMLINAYSAKSVASCRDIVASAFRHLELPLLLAVAVLHCSIGTTSSSHGTPSFTLHYMRAIALG